MNALVAMEDKTVYSKLCLLLLLLQARFPSNHATYSVFISTSELERYFQGTPALENVQGLSVGIIHDGVSLVLGDGSLQLVLGEGGGGGGPTESPTDSGLGSGMSVDSEVEQGPTETPVGSGMSALLGSFSSVIPSLPPHVDEVAFSWFASTNNVNYELSLSADLFQEISLNVSSYGTIPLQQSGFTIRFPCSDNVSGVGTLWVNLTSSTSNTSRLAPDENIMVTSFKLVKKCQADLSSDMSSMTSTPTPSHLTAISTASPSLDYSGKATPTGSVTPTPIGSVTPTPVTVEQLVTSSSSETLLLPYFTIMPEPDSSTDGTTSASSSTSFSPTPVLSTTPPTPHLPSSFPPPPSSHVPSVSQSVVEVTGTSMLPTPGVNITPPSGGPTADEQFVVLLLLVFSPVVCVLILSICIICCSICMCIYCSKKRRNADPTALSVNPLPNNDYLNPVTIEMDESKYEVPISLWMALPWGTVSSLPAGTQGVIRRHNIDRLSLSILSTISRGDFGCIVKGQLIVDQAYPVSGNRGVMMKMCIGFQKQYGHRDEISRFLECSTLLRDMDHAHVHSVLHVSVEDNYVPVVVYPSMEYGNLHHFLTLCRITPLDSPLNPITIQHKVSFALQIASGMKHLSEKGVVHPDLALRNCFLDTNYQVKVSDGALAPCFHPECYYSVRGTVRPVRWAAVETLQEGLCTSHSNVWSYGVTLWEVMTLSKLPYCAELDHNRCVLSHLLMGNRLGQPEDCPDNIYSLMTDCWKKSAESRPNLSSVHSTFVDIHSKYVAEPSTVSSTSHLLSNTNYSTFGKDIRPQLSVESAGGYSSRNRRKRSISQRNTPQADKLSITFSVLSDDNYVDHSSESETEELEGREFAVDVPVFIMGKNNCERQLYPPTMHTDMEHSSPIGSVNGMSTFLGECNVPHSILDHTSGTSSFHPPHATTGIRHSRPPPPPPPHVAPPDVTVSAIDHSPQHVTHTKVPSNQSLRPLVESGTLLPPCHLSNTTLHSNAATTSSILMAKGYSDTGSKASTLDSIATFGSGPGANSNTPSGHILGLPGGSYNRTSVSIDDVKLRNKSLLSANGQTGTGEPSCTPSATSKSDSGIRSDDEADLMLSNGCAPPPMEVVAKRVSIRNMEGSEANFGISNLSSDLMSAFASWGK